MSLSLCVCVSRVPHSTSPFAQISYTDADGVLPAGSPPLRLPNMLICSRGCRCGSTSRRLYPRRSPASSLARALRRRRGHLGSIRLHPLLALIFLPMLAAERDCGSERPTWPDECERPEKSTKLIRKKHRTDWARCHVDRPPHMEYTMAAAWNAVYDAM